MIPQTRSGREVKLRDPLPQNIEINDIAHHLSNLCRYNGATNIFYSVAEHSVRAAELAAIFGKEAQFAVLMHDGHEAYIGDFARPVIQAFGPEFKKILEEMRSTLDAAIEERFGFSFGEFGDIVSLADETMIQIERVNIIDREVGEWPDRAHHALDLTHPSSRAADWGWSPRKASEAFLRAFRQLAPALPSFSVPLAAE